ncbi:GGDEF domain-containing protein [Methylomicrobium agile]|uniref:GGDEF domain-containing protein n=1 Tax=Methylomicrobium agile TaxID=39774 RepID=UPI0004DFAA06|nr:diguanylate cyclase [Methylomicrobium agile]
MMDPVQLFTQLHRHLYRRTTTVFVIHCLYTVLLAAYLWLETPRSIFLTWFIIAMFGGIWHWFAGRLTLRYIGKDTLKGGSLTSDIIAAGAAGLGFGFTPLLFPYLSLTTKLAVILMLGVIAAEALPRLSALLPVYAAFLLGLLVPLVSVLALADQELGRNAIPPILLMGISLFYSAHLLHKDLLESLLSRFGLENAAEEDELTHLANRRRFDIGLEQEWFHARRSEQPISLIMVDVDFFKKFNDRYGHQEGDRCLAQVARALSRSVRRATDLVARYGGEEFVIVLSHTTRDDAYALCELMRGAVEKLGIPHLDSTLGRVTISMGGVTLYARENLKAVELVRTADKALYRAKATGRNKVVWYDPVLDENEKA